MPVPSCKGSSRSVHPPLPCGGNPIHPKSTVHHAIRSSMENTVNCKQIWKWRPMLPICFHPSAVILLPVVSLDPKVYQRYPPCRRHRRPDDQDDLPLKIRIPITKMWIPIPGRSLHSLGQSDLRRRNRPSPRIDFHCKCDSTMILW